MRYRMFAQVADCATNGMLFPEGRRHAAELGIDLRRAVANPACRAYTDFRYRCEIGRWDLLG
jgi:hypothetical protein